MEDEKYASKVYYNSNDRTEEDKDGVIKGIPEFSEDDLLKFTEQHLVDIERLKRLSQDNKEKI